MITIQQEHYSTKLCEELLPLLQANWRESPSYEEGLEADPDLERYRRLDEAGAVLCLTAREEARLVGYVVMIVSMSLHHKTILCGLGNAIYVEPEHRGKGVTLLNEAEQMLRARGVKRLGWLVDPGSPIHQLLKGCGYHDDEVMVEKRL